MSPQPYADGWWSAEVRMTRLVELMLDLHRQLPKAKIPHDQESLQRQIAATDKQLDALVYELRSLPNEGIRIVGAMAAKF